MKDWKTIFENLSEDDKFKLAVLRVIECTNGIIQYAHRENRSYAVSIEETRRAMKFSMSSIKNLIIPLGDEEIIFDGDIVEHFTDIRNLYLSGAKRGNDEDYEEFMRASGIMIKVLGEERIVKAHDYLFDKVTELDPNKLVWGVDYMRQYL
tara:strand:+ start:89 stop:541 length:453 start_codon:yes stop_codon:yes gene_type:complete